MDHPSPHLSKLEAQCMSAWIGMDEDYGYLSFRNVASRGKIPPHLARRVTRALARKGLVQYANGLWDDEGGMRGAGYGLTKAGRVYVEAHCEKDDA